MISTTEDINPEQMIVYVEAHSRHRLADHSAFCGSARICARDVTTPRNPRGSSFRTSWMSWIIRCAHSSCAGQSPSDPDKDTTAPIHYLILPPFTVTLQCASVDTAVPDKKGVGLGGKYGGCSLLLQSAILTSGMPLKRRGLTL